MTIAEPTENIAAGEIPSVGPAWFRRDWFFGLLLCLGVLVAYGPVRSAQFVWDDNFLVAAPNQPTISEIWTTRAADNAPLTRTIFTIERAIWGLNPMPYHVVNVFLHALCAVLLWQVLRKLRIPGAWLGAAIWALHPVQVESAAWVAETKNTLSAAFLLLAIYFFSRFVQRGDGHDDRRPWDYALMLLCSAVAMASKSSTVILPVVLCLCAWWLEREWRWRTMWNTVPVFFLSMAASAVTMWTASLLIRDSRDPILHPEWIRPLPARIVMAGDAVWLYLGKLAWPHPVFTMYRQWEIDTTRWISWLPALAVIAVLGLLWMYRNSRGRAGFFVFALFLAALLPVVGLVEQPILRYAFVFDHFQYLADMAPLALVGAGLSKAAQWAGSRVMLLPNACLLAILAVLTWQRAETFENSLIFWTDAVTHNPAAWDAHNSLGNAFLSVGQHAKAVVQFRESLKYNVNNPNPHNGIGVALAGEKHFNEAMEEFRNALRIDPTYPDARRNLERIQNFIYRRTGPHS